jgi:hypothetical protein
VGNAKLTIKGIGNYTGSIERPFEIYKQVPDTSCLNYSLESVVYDGQHHPIEVTADTSCGVCTLTDTYYKLENGEWKLQTPPADMPLQVGAYQVKVCVGGCELYADTCLELGEFNILSPTPSTQIPWDWWYNGDKVDTIGFGNVIGADENGASQDLLFMFDYQKFEREWFQPETTKVILVRWYRFPSLNYSAPTEPRYWDSECTGAGEMVGIGLHYIDNSTKWGDSVSYFFDVFTHKKPTDVKAICSEVKKIAVAKRNPTVQSKAMPLQAYPSVASKGQAIKIEVDTAYLGQDIEVYSTMGVLVFKGTVKDTVTTISLDEMSGTYFVKVDGLQTKVVIK